MPVLGIDVSHNNDQVDWTAVAGSDAKFAFVKATEGNSIVDGRFDENWKALGDTHLLRGAYHFARPGGDPEIQAAHFAAVVGQRTWSTLPPALDLEVDGGLPPAQLVQWAVAFVNKAETLFGQPLIIYTGGLWRRTLRDPDVPELRSRLLWTARYGAQEPVVPRTWARWDFWQFTDGDSGNVQKIPGVRGPCDCDRFRGELAELQALADKPLAPAEPPPPAPPEAGRPAWGGRYLVWPHGPVMNGEDVRTWQTQMRERRFAVDIDGFYGRQSRQACIALQREMGLEPDGIVGRETWNATFDVAP
jgi:lysozyme